MSRTLLVQQGTLPRWSVAPYYPSRHTLVHALAKLYRKLGAHSPCLGDPTTPGYPAYENATRVEADSIPKIPSLPISWANAQRLLAEISDGHDARKLNGVASDRKIRLVNHGEIGMNIWHSGR